MTGLSAQVTLTGTEGANNSLHINALGGNDTINAAALAAGQIKLTIDGGSGNDTILGSAGNDTLIGGDGNDFVDGNQGSDVAFLGAGNDTFQWDPGDGSDIVEGEDGTDTLLFNGANTAEKIDISANGTRTRLFRDVGNVTMDLGGIEHIQLNMLGGADTITVQDLSGTDINQVAIDLSSPAGSGTGDGAADTVITNGTANNDQISVTNSGNVDCRQGSRCAGHRQRRRAAQRLARRQRRCRQRHHRRLRICMPVRSTSRSTAVMAMTGSSAAPAMMSSTAATGSDVALLGAGDDVFVWNPGDGSDTVDGQAGSTRFSSMAPPSTRTSISRRMAATSA